MISEAMAYSRFLVDSSLNVLDILKQEYIRRPDYHYQEQHEKYRQEQIGQHGKSNHLTFPKEWDVATKVAVSLLKQVLTHGLTSVDRIRSSSNLFWLPIPSDIVIKHVKFSYSLQRVMDLERHGKIFSNSLLPPVPIERKMEKMIDIEGEWVYTKGNENSDRVILYVHGGAFFCGSSRTHRMLTTRISREMNARVFVFNYRLSPDFAFPAALHDTFSAYLYLTNPLHTLFPISNKANHQPISPQNIILMGDSAGGGLCLSLLLYLKDYLKKSSNELQFHLPLGACLFSPWIDLTCSSTSWKTNRSFDYLPSPPSDSNTFFSDFFPSQRGNPVQWYTIGNMKQYLSLMQTEEGSNYKLSDILSDLDVFKLVCHPLVSPLFGDLKGLPPIMIHSGDAEVLRDESIALVKKLHQVNPIRPFFYRHHKFRAMPHVFQMLTWAEESKKSMSHFQMWTNALFDKESLYMVGFDSCHLVKCMSLGKELEKQNNMVSLSSMTRTLKEDMSCKKDMSELNTTESEEIETKLCAERQFNHSSVFLSSLFGVCSTNLIENEVHIKVNFIHYHPFL